MSILGSRLDKMKIGFVGVGNMAVAILKSILESKLITSSQIYISNRSSGKLEKVKSKFGVNAVNTNEELVDHCDIIFAAMKPQDFVEAFEPIAKSFTEDKIFISLAAGITVESIQKILPDVKNIFRIMPNTPAKINRAVVGYCMSASGELYEDLIKKLLDPTGMVLRVEEGEQFEALTVASGSGIGFVFELMLYWEDWLKGHGFSISEARRITVETFLGGALLASKQESISIEELQRQVVSKKGVTHAGLESMRELELERILRLSFEKAVLRDRSLGEN